MNTNRNHIFLAISIGLVAPITAFLFSKKFIADWAGVNIPVHAVFEALGFFASIFLSIILLQRIENKKDTSFFVMIGSGLIALGILDGFHALTAPGNTFVWLHSIAVLLGGLFFAINIFLMRQNPIKKVWNLPIIVAIFSILIGVYSLFYPETLPIMTSDGKFTQTSNAINIIGGILFLIASTGLIIRLWNTKNTFEILLTIFCLLMGASGIIFPLSEIWTLDWWNWHLTRVLAYIILLSYILYLFSDSFKKMNVLTESLLTRNADMNSLTETLNTRNADMNNLFLEIEQSIQVLTSSSSEIMASVTQLASSSVETATSVGETTTTVEQVKQTAIVSNHKAKMVSDNSFRMIEISRDGHKSIANTIEGMNKIRQQMSAIASMVVRLSEQSQTIGEITTSVNELAEQSNLLAVNAAIEAAKAGEQGKGFTVVAQEIKLLANRSKEATAQVRSILRDVQKSISSAVMATEEGGKAVDEGIKLTNLSGDAIRTLSESIEEASNAAVQITASSQQQLEGMDQVVIAMENIRESSMQAVTSTQQSVESVSELQKVGQKLEQLMKQYNLG